MILWGTSSHEHMIRRLVGLSMNHEKCRMNSPGSLTYLGLPPATTRAKFTTQDQQLLIAA